VFSGNPNMVNNTVALNHTTLTTGAAYGGGVYCFSTASITGSNNIVYANTASQNNPNYFGPISFTYSCALPAMTGTGNIDQNPSFVNIPGSLYSMLSQTASGQTSDSPCLNAGDPGSTMATGSTRTDMVQDAGIVDIGYHWTTTFGNWFNVTDALDLEEPAAFKEANLPVSCNISLSNYPNPFNPETTINLVLQESSEIELTVTDITGRVVETLYNGVLPSGVSRFTFSGANLSSGVYFYTAKSGNTIVSGKALLVK
jgi:hypothetical protein